MDKSAIALISALSLSPTQQAVVEGICAEFAALPQVLAIALAGSQTTTDRIVAQIWIFTSIKRQKFQLKSVLYSLPDLPSTAKLITNFGKRAMNG